MNIAVKPATRWHLRLDHRLVEWPLEQEVGANFGKLLQLYGVYKATAEARKKGFSVLRQPQRNGEHQNWSCLEVPYEPVHWKSSCHWTGEIKIDAVGFKGADCEQAHGVPGSRARCCERNGRKKPEYHQSRTAETSSKGLGG